MQYSHKAIEKKWQKFWEENKTYKTTNNNSKKAYILDMFPYPSGSGLHVGHPKGYTASDIIARLRRMQGFDVLHPIGWDAFGLPAEQYALQTGNDPAEFTLKNIDHFRKQLKALGFSFDYDKEVNTSSSNYYRNTQWIFNQLYKNGLAEQKEIDVNWCEELGTVLANEEVLVENGKMVSERGNFPVVKRPMKQWILKITNYAERLLSDLDELDWPESIKESQRNWIGKSEGVEIRFNIENSDFVIDVFTTRADTICGVTYLVLAPEHPLVKQITLDEFLPKVNEFIEFVKTKTDLERQDNSKEKNGIFIGSYAINPVTNEKLPIWIADYVLPTYATGSVMAVAAHDERDFVFALKYNLPIKYVIEGFYEGKVCLKDGKHINSLFLNGLTTNEAIKTVAQFLIKEKKGKFKVNYKLRDWLFSRQRYWGEPFPIIHWEDNTITLVEDSQLPLVLPKMSNITLSKTSESPLANATQWLNVEKDNLKGKRETNTMPQWAGSCWYYLGYILTKTSEDIIDIDSPVAQDLFKKWLPVDLYVGGQEHAVLHLLYARFWHKFLYDIKIVPTKEPFYKLVNQGMILGENNEKMSKSKGNVINPDDIVKSHGADALRLYEMFMGPINASLAWSVEGLDGARKWLDRVYRLFENIEIVQENSTNLDFAYHNMVKNITNLLEKLDFNNAVSQMMIFINAVYKEQQVYKPYLEDFCKILSLYAPHLAEELWEKLGHNRTITYETWPTYDEKYLVKDIFIIPVQVNGKLKATLEVAKNIDQKELMILAEIQPNVINALKNKTIVKKIVVPGKIINFVVK